MSWLKFTTAAAVAVIAPIKMMLLGVGFLIFADLVTGLWAALKLKEKIRSAVMRRTVSKMVVYQLAIISAFVLEAHIMGISDLTITKIVASAIGMVELKSILENANKISGIDVFKSLLNKLGSDNDPRNDNKE